MKRVDLDTVGKPSNPGYGRGLIIDDDDERYLNALPCLAKEMILADRFEIYQRYAETLAFWESLKTKRQRFVYLTEEISPSEPEEEVRDSLPGQELPHSQASDVASTAESGSELQAEAADVSADGRVSGHSGVIWCRKSLSWRARVRARERRFSVKRYGEAESLKMAIAWRYENM
jgi:AP2 domain